MEEQWLVDRARLRQLMYDQPDWTNPQYADALGHCLNWVKKWKKRLRGTTVDDESALHSQSRARKTPPAPYHPDVLARILELRDHPPDTVPRKLGPLPILYFLHQDEALKACGHRLPRSASTIWKILDGQQRILRPPKVAHISFERPAPMDTWEIDFTDVAGAQADHDRKQTHQVEAFAVVDRGTSILVDLQVSDHYQAQTALVAMTSTLLQQGLPRCIVFDRDPRFVGSWSAADFPSAFMRFLLSLGLEVIVCPPQRPDLKPFVERYFRTLDEECIQVRHPQNTAQARETFDAHRYTYNHVRPHQANVCGNRPPYTAFPRLPRLPHIPERVDPDRWLLKYHHRMFRRRVDSAGRVQIDKQRYYIRRDLVGRYVVCKLDAQRRVFDVLLNGQHLKSMAIKDLYGAPLLFADYLELMMQDAEAEQRRLERQRRIQAS
jgi:hypothetical protein